MLHLKGSIGARLNTGKRFEVDPKSWSLNIDQNQQDSCLELSRLTGEFFQQCSERNEPVQSGMSHNRGIFTSH